MHPDETLDGDATCINLVVISEQHTTAKCTSTARGTSIKEKFNTHLWINVRK